MSIMPKRTVLDNGARILHQRLPSNPFVAFYGCIWAGTASEKKRGVAEFTSRLLLSGTKKTKMTQLAESIERLGATLDFRNGEEALHFFGRCPKATTGRVFGLLAECLSRPSFPASEVERVRGETLDEMRMDMDDTMRRAGKELMQCIYPGHLYGKDPRGEVGDVKRIERGDIVSFHEDRYGPRGMIVSLSGDVDDELVLNGIAPVIERLEGEGERPKLPRPGKAKVEKRVVPMPHKSQADIAIGLPAIPRDHPDFYALGMVNLLFGRIGMYGRLGRDLRDEQGLAYYSFSTFEARRVGGHFVISAGVNPGNLLKAVGGISTEIKKLHQKPLTDEEISDGKDNQVGSLKVMLERNAEMAGELFRMEYFGLGLDYLKRYPDIVNGLATKQIHDAAKRYIRAEDCSVAIAGPVEKNLEKSLGWP